MRTKINIKVVVGVFSFLLPLSFLFSSCSEQMDYKEYSIYDAAYMQKKFERAGGLLSTIYADLDSDFGNYDGATLASATDEA
ncbi:MAG: hypothetical protein II429_00920, partial [Prevotella sp.]|nr:hypothetical protein [Prevotella sp.]